MKKITLLLSFIVFSFTLNAQVQNYNIGDVVDDFTVTDTSGNEHNLYSITAQGKYVFLDFFFVDCGPCQVWQPTFSELHDKYGCNEGEVYCLSINRGFDNDAQVIAYEEMYGGPFEHAPAASMDGGSAAVRTNFGISAYPTFCLINPNNEIINLDIWPLTGVETFEAAFPAGFDPDPAPCSLGIEDNVAAGVEVVLFPNPSSGSNITLKLSTAISFAEVVIYDLSGKKVFSQNYDTSVITLNTKLASGVYLVGVKTDLGDSFERLIIN